MKFDCNNIKTCVNAETAEMFSYGYFSNDIASLKEAIKEERSSFKVVYTMLNGVFEESREKRFSCAFGVFALYYPVDKVNRERY